MAPRVWFISGCSTGIGNEIAKAAIARGDKVIATARSISKLDELKTLGANTLALDVLYPLDRLVEIAKSAYAIYGHIDILVNNAGYVLEGTVEEATPEETVQQFNTNVFGLLNVTRAFLPLLRAQRSGVIANVSSIRAWESLPAVGIYSASKAAVLILSDTLSYELAELSIEVCSVEPGSFRTSLLNSGSNRQIAKPTIQDYEGTTSRGFADALGEQNNKQVGDPMKAAKAITEVLTKSGRAEGRKIPLRLVLGTDGFDCVTKRCKDTADLLSEWKEITVSTDISSATRAASST